MTRHLHRLRLASLEAVAPPEPVPGAPTVGDLLDAVPDPDERQRLTSALAELVALDARRRTLTDDEREHAADLAAVLHRGLFGRPEARPDARDVLGNALPAPATGPERPRR